MKKILVIEDNYEVRDNICEILELSGYEALSAENGKEGVRLATSDVPDLILCDVMMPELDGFGVLKILNNNPITLDIPFIFLTARAEKSDFRKGMGLGADDYITKPFDDTELLEAIDMRLKKKAKLKSLEGKSDTHLKRFFSEAKADASLRELSDDREVRKYRSKDPIYEEGRQPRWLFFIVTGKVKINKINEFGKELITHIYNPGDFFGHLALLENKPYMDNAYALEECEIRLIPNEDFSLLMYNNRDFAAQFIKMIAHSTLDVEQQLIELAYSSVRRRVAQALLAHLSEDSNIIHVSRDNLAATAGTAKETLIRTLSDFKSEGHVEIEGTEIKILNKEKLESMPQ